MPYKDELKLRLIEYGKWLGKNNFGRNSFGIWSNNCSSFKRMNDAEIVHMYLNNPNEYQDFLKELGQKELELALKNNNCNNDNKDSE